MRLGSSSSLHPLFYPFYPLDGELGHVNKTIHSYQNRNGSFCFFTMLFDNLIPDALDVGCRIASGANSG